MGSPWRQIAATLADALEHAPGSLSADERAVAALRVYAAACELDGLPGQPPHPAYPCAACGLAVRWSDMLACWALARSLGDAERDVACTGSKEGHKPGVIDSTSSSAVLALAGALLRELPTYSLAEVRKGTGWPQGCRFAMVEPRPQTADQTDRGGNPELPKSRS